MKKIIFFFLVIWGLVSCESDNPSSESSSIRGFWRSEDLHYQCYMYYEFHKGGRFTEYEQHPTNGMVSGKGDYIVKGDIIEFKYDDEDWADNWSTEFSFEGNKLIMYDNPNSQKDRMILIRVNDFVDF